MPHTYLPARLWGLHPLFHADVRLLAAHLESSISSSPDLTESHFLYETHPIQKAHMVGLVVRTLLSRDRRVLQINDGTGVAQASLFETNVDGSLTLHLRAEVGDVVVLRGKLATQWKMGKENVKCRELRIRSIRKLGGYDELALQFMHTVREHIDVYRRSLKDLMPRGIDGLDAYTRPDLLVPYHPNDEGSLMAAVAAVTGGACPIDCAQRAVLALREAGQDVPREADEATAVKASPVIDWPSTEPGFDPAVLTARVARVVNLLSARHVRLAGHVPVSDGGAAAFGAASDTIRSESAGLPSPTPGGLIPEQFTAALIQPFVSSVPPYDGAAASALSSSSSPSAAWIGEDGDMELTLAAVRVLVRQGRLFVAPEPPRANQLDETTTYESPLRPRKRRRLSVVDDVAVCSGDSEPDDEYRGDEAMLPGDLESVPDEDAGGDVAMSCEASQLYLNGELDALMGSDGSPASSDSDGSLASTDAEEFLACITADSPLGVISTQHVTKPAVLAALRASQIASATGAAPGSSAPQLVTNLRRQPPLVFLQLEAVDRCLAQLVDEGSVLRRGDLFAVAAEIE